MATATGLDVYEVNGNTEMDSENHVARNDPANLAEEGGNMHTQRGLRIVDMGDAQDPEGMWGRSRYGTTNECTPGNGPKIFTGTIEDDLPVGWEYATAVDRTILHEVGHSINLSQDSSHQELNLDTNMLEPAPWHHNTGIVPHCRMEQLINQNNYSCSSFCNSCKSKIKLR